jgi:hypothetical protein
MTICFSRMNFPSLYFWDSSKATSYRGPQGRAGDAALGVSGAVAGVDAAHARAAPPAKGACSGQRRPPAHVFPAQEGVARGAVEVADLVHPCDELPVLSWA